MKIKNLLLVVLCILIISTLILSAEEKYDFRKTNWGMSMEEVKGIETLDEILFSLPIFITTKEYKPPRTDTIQVARSFSKEEAQDLAEQINDIGYQTYVVKKEEDLYRVQVGEFKSYKEAQSLLDKMEKDKELRKILKPPTRFDLLRYQDHINVISQDYIFIFDCDICYWFLEDKLHQSLYSLNKGILDEDPCLEDYEGLKKFLTKKYGKPTIDEEEWIDDLAKKNELNRGTAINKGCLTYMIGWETSTTKIFMIISGYRNKTYLNIWYISKELEKWVDKIRAENRQIREKEALEALEDF